MNFKQFFFLELIVVLLLTLATSLQELVDSRKRVPHLDPTRKLRCKTGHINRKVRGRRPTAAKRVPPSPVELEERVPAERL
ncbi:hypothetical protein JG687_00005105 [Phytophthora cactorum]|uniref:RxLR effector protein n=1 Tax=Phytophthora cactorum TaxID=29920 RepID=A0A329SWT1_9STRA|nr:hypothetical protein Pcac1_g15472 [Phytophthora cactorum]KAG2838794.1 hypothetical protein PC112_g4345 [Phytophthora cactorum]KAG2840783.1 hypothetical protein PC111_g3333 [Phytophthora cactorum]KAG2864789.1 hypothetical protein PC113_g4239 [Phytophthora cactorum]KAG2923814.1 hypothetical protein PC114_g4656 [Phytophthora cactorum]